MGEARAWSELSISNANIPPGVALWLLRAFESVCGERTRLVASGLPMGFELRAWTAALKRKSRGVAFVSSFTGWGRARGLEGVVSISGSISAVSLSASRVGARPDSGSDLEKKLGIGRADGAGEAWNVGPA